ncbi:MAG: flagellar hook-basal body complex protein FliE [Thermodesulfobacteriota bacterium]|nr:MAG: flagellar hook-basal body complex protein FliE [Thermodesulfobacteriota bacterium]
MVDSIKGALSAELNSLGKATTEAASGTGFSDVLKQSIESVNKLQSDADQAIQGLASGQVNNIHDTMIAIEKASLSFNLMLQVRNKLVHAYEEVMRTQV